MPETTSPSQWQQIQVDQNVTKYKECSKQKNVEKEFVCSKAFLAYLVFRLGGLEN